MTEREGEGMGAHDEEIEIGSSETLVPRFRRRGEAGPPPLDDRTEISWATLDGIDVVVKSGGPLRRDELRREAEVLRRCRGAGVVELLDVVEGPDHVELVTQRVGLGTLADTALLPLQEVGSALVEACSAVADLHAAGWTHGGLERTHILLGDHGARLCSLGSAVHVGSDDTRYIEDRVTLLGLVREVLTEPAAFASLRERRRWSRAAGRTLRHLERHGSVPSAEAMVAVLVDARLPGATLTTSEPRSEDALDLRSGRSGTRGPVPVDELAVGAALGVVPNGRRRPLFRPHGAAMVVAASAVGTLALLLGWQAGWRVAGPSGDDRVDTCIPVSSGGLDIDGDGCVDEVTVDANVVETGSARYQVGLPGDLAAVGDWDCDGRATVSLLRPGTGELFTFDRWAGAGDALDADLVGRLDGAVSLVEPESGCAPLEVVLDDGTSVSLLGGTPDADDGGAP